MIRLISIIVLLSVSFVAIAQTDSTHTAAKKVQTRYDKSNDNWRINIINYILKNEEQKYNDTIKKMKLFTLTTRSYVDLRREGQDNALTLYYRNLENLRKVQQLSKLVKDFRKDENPTPDFQSKYKLENDSFTGYKKYKTSYENLMNKWRIDYEDAMKQGDKDKIDTLRKDMALLEFSVMAFILFPGESATKIPELQVIKKDLNHAIMMLKMFSASMSTTNK